MSDPFFTPVKKSGGGGPRKHKVFNPAPKLDTGKKNKATTSLAGKRKLRGDSDDETSGRGGAKGGRKKPSRNQIENDDEGGDEIGAGGIDDMDLEFHDSDLDDDEDENLNETAAQKRLRLAKGYIDNLQTAQDDDFGFDAEEIDRDNIADRLKQDALEIQGRLHRQLADTFKLPIDPETIMTRRGHQLSVTSIAATENGLYVYTGSKDGSIIKWDLKTGKKLHLFPGARKGIEKFKGHTDHVTALAASSDNRYLASGGKDRKINIWSVEENKLIHCFKHQHKDTVTSMAFRKTGGQHNQLYTVSADRTVKLWNVDEMSYIETLFGHQDSISAIDSLAKEHCVTTGGRDRTVRLWKIVEESQLVFRGGGFVKPKKLNKDKDESELFASTAKPSSVSSASDQASETKKKAPSFLEGSMDCLAMIDEENFVTGGDSGTISLWNVNKKKAAFSMPLAHGFNTQPLDYSSGDPIPSGGVETPYWITSLASLRYSDTFASGSWDGTVRIWKLGNGLKSFALICTIPVIGVVNALQLYQPTISKKTLLIAGVGQEHKAGRWLRIKEGRNCVKVIAIPSISKTTDQSDDEDDEDSGDDSN
ncbi:pre-rRNA processing protein [Lunasporangiospora selenospora]|uniref:Pre-rRNA processing protein n=1 Tax=Lunasporangiospora selenospora TaxID=979761 RepID=A0A9P6FZP3_9FUNG|nr:pre-rRNA processing protein [Lunasporangiospora selenospora]